jgi:hypothetical protein
MGTVYNVCSKSLIPREPRYFADRLVVEECENMHIHYRNLRLEFSDSEFIQFAGCIRKAFAEFVKKHSVSVPIDLISPYNSTHPEGFENTDKHHREGIDLIKRDMQDRKEILPILVKPNGDGYLRMDGFKRYFAFKELGHIVIPCFISANAKRGGQDGLSWLV